MILLLQDLFYEDISSVEDLMLNYIKNITLTSLKVKTRFCGHREVELDNGRVRVQIPHPTQTEETSRAQFNPMGLLSWVGSEVIGFGG